SPAWSRQSLQHLKLIPCCRVPEAQGCRPRASDRRQRSDDQPPLLHETCDSKALRLGYSQDEVPCARLWPQNIRTESLWSPSARHYRSIPPARFRLPGLASQSTRTLSNSWVSEEAE